ncbi:unnamed protein product [Echinostoma caproni]|uniref:Uncharacterized protein n=1 Tax=Echinostoma caproni TaxID=27848 RepID=A0A183BA52_9TREM|nr:unnamed protein product [Echinostoma caproni]
MQVDGETPQTAPNTDSTRDADSQHGDFGENSELHSFSDRPLSTLAEMLARHRQLWRSAEPYLEQWENMINSESLIQEKLHSTRHNPGHRDEVESASREDAARPSDSETTTRTLSPPARSVVPEGVAASLSEHTWHHHVRIDNYFI